MHHHTLGAIEAVKPQVRVQPGHVGGQALKGLHLCGASLTRQQQAVEAHIGADVGAEITWPQLAAPELHRGPVGEAGLALLAVGHQAYPQPIHPGDHAALGGEHTQAPEACSPPGARLAEWSQILRRP